MFTRCTNCPLPTCPNPKDRGKRFRNLPARLFELAPEIRDPIIKDLQIPPNVTKCCLTCLIRIKRKMGTHLMGQTQLTDDEIQHFRKQLQEIGPQWSQLAEQLNKSAIVLKSFYYHYKKKYGFDQAVNEYYKVHTNEDRRPTMTDGGESDVSVTSSDDNAHDSKNDSNDVHLSNVNCNPNATGLNQLSNTNVITSNNLQPAGKDIMLPTKENNNSNINSIHVVSEDRLLPPLGQPPPLLNSQQIQNLTTNNSMPPSMSLVRNKKQSEDYDSSATETADEENDASPANRQSPKVSTFVVSTKILPSTTISMVPSINQQNGPPANVRDAMLDVIERQLKNASAGPQPMKNVMSSLPPLKSNVPLMNQQSNDNRPDITFVREYRNDGNSNKIQMQPQRTNAEGLATLSIVNSHGPPLNQQQQQQQQQSQQQSQLQIPSPQQQLLSGHHLGISSQIAATITPVPPLTSQQQQRPPSNPQQQGHLNSMHDSDSMVKVVIRKGDMGPMPRLNPEPEPQTLDLSIKKPQQQQDRSFPSPAHTQKSVPPPPTGTSMYRGDPSLQAQPNIPTNQTYLAYHPDVQQRHPKSPQTYITPLSPGSRVMTMNSHLMQQQQMQQQQQQASNKTKLTPKLSPKMIHHQAPQQLNGPKGSITHGTPLMDNRGQPIMIQGSNVNNQGGPRYDILRQTPPSGDKIGSITQGTPIMTSMGDKRHHEYLKNSRHSPMQNQPPTSTAPAGSPHQQSQFQQPYSAPYSVDPPMSSRQLIMSDYLTSQQMHGQQSSRQVVGVPNNLTNTINIVSGVGNPGNRPEKDAPPPRGMVHSNSPASIYYGDKDRDRAGSGQTRTEYLSRSSPAESNR